MAEKTKEEVKCIDTNITPENNTIVKKEDIFNILNAVNVNSYVEKKNDLSYLSWSDAWQEFRRRCPDAEYEIERFDGKPYLADEYGIMVFTKVTTGGQTYEMWLPVMDGANKAMKAEPYEYKVKNYNFKYAKKNKEDGKYYDSYGNEQTEYITKTCEAVTMFDINKAIMRCLTKNLAMFGLGLYIYAGEDLPSDERAAQEEEKKQAEEKRQEEAKKRAEEMKEPIGEDLASALEYDLKTWGVGKEFFLMYAKARKLENVTKGQYEWAKAHVDTLKAKEAENGKK